LLAPDPVIFWLSKKIRGLGSCKGLEGFGLPVAYSFARSLPESDPVIFWLSKKYAASDPANGWRV
jgi:hypothetical protein